MLLLLACSTPLKKLGEYNRRYSGRNRDPTKAKAPAVRENRWGGAIELE